jgi:hypothetical protein
MMRMKTTHKCPAPNCLLQVPNSMLSCRPHWYVLSLPTRAAIYATAGLPLTAPSRRDALAAAVEEWNGSQ